ncbi:hypothetical protein Tco_1340037 [Tanacetum coccineum]
MVIEGEVLNDFPRLVSILIAEFAAAGAVNLALKMKGDMTIKKLNLKPMIDAMMRDLLESSESTSFKKSLRCLNPQTEVHEMSIRFAPTRWCRIEEIASPNLGIFPGSGAKNLMRLSLDFNKKFYNSLGSVPNRCSVV